MSKLSAEFDELYRLGVEMGFKGEDVEKFMVEVLHSINEAIKGCIADGRSKV